MALSNSDVIECLQLAQRTVEKLGWSLQLMVADKREVEREADAVRQWINDAIEAIEGFETMYQNVGQRLAEIAEAAGFEKGDLYEPSDVIERLRNSVAA